MVRIIRHGLCPRQRTGFSLIELIVVMAIIAIMVGLLLVAVISSRKAATMLQSKNNLKQISLATLHYNDVQIPDRLAPPNYPEGQGFSGISLLSLILPYLDVPGMDGVNTSVPPKVVKTYQSPADPSWDTKPMSDTRRYRCSYAVNMWAISDGLNLTSGVPDGTSSTVAFCETYFYAQKDEQFLNFDYVFRTTNPAKPNGTRRPSFADAGWNDAVPVSDGQGHTVSSRPGVTFQSMPAVKDARGHSPKTPYSAGLLVAFFDGSVHTLKPSIDERVYWALVTHNGGEVVGDY